MKIKYFQKLTTKLSVLPMLFVMAVFIAGGAGLYFYGHQYLLKYVLGLYVSGMVSEKKIAITSRLENYLEDLAKISNNPVIRDNAAIITKETTNSQKEGAPAQRRKVRSAVSRAQTEISAALDNKALAGGYNMFSVLSGDGRVISSSRREMEGADWSGRDFYKNAVRIRAATMTGFYNCDGPGYCMEFVAPVLDANGDVQAILHSLADMKDLTVFLQTAKSPYKSGKIEMIDMAGNVVLTKDGVPAKKTRYNIPGENTGNGIRYKDNLFFNITGLTHVPFRLIYTVSAPEVVRPLYILLIAYSSLCIFIVLIMMVQKSYFSRFISRPVTRLVNAVKLIALNDLDLDMGKEYKGELQDLKKEMETMVEVLKSREARLRENIESQQRFTLRPIFFNNISREASPHLNSMVKNLEQVLESGPDLRAANRKTMGKVVSSARVLLSLMEGLLDLSRLEQGKLSVSQEEFIACGLLDEIEGIVRGLAGLKEIELVVDCHEALANKPVYTDRNIYRQILLNIAGNAMTSTEVGTVTILMSETVKEGVEYLEVSVADTGKGISPEVLEQLSDEFSVLPSCLWLVVSKKLTGALGGKMEIESRAGMGSAITVILPVKARIY